VNAEGWYVDPYGRHEARWFSDGTPTQLVRDGGAEARDPPPNTPYTGELQPIFESASSGPDDMRRADETEGPFAREAVAEAPWEVFDETAGSD
jgi:hypothetical protein